MLRGLLIVFCILVSFDAAASEKQALTFVYAYPADHPQTKRLIRLVKEASRRVGYNFVFEHYPAKRATAYAKKGIVDGEMIRVRHYGDLHPELVRVEEHHTVDRFVAYVMNPKIKLNGWGSFRSKGFAIDYRRGVMVPENTLPNIVPEETLFAVDSVASAYRRLVRGRSDIFIDSEGSSENFLNSDSDQNIIEGKKIYRAGFMLITTGHVWLNEKHRHLAPMFSEAFRKMKLELPRYFKQPWEQ